MATYTDYQLVRQIRLGHGEALGQLYDRYGADVFDFLSCVVGDPAESVYLVADVFTRFSTIAGSIAEHVSIRGNLFALARETGFAFLHQRGWLDALPSMTPMTIMTPDFANDVWQAARAMPAVQRAALAIVEHHVLSPMEQANAMGVVRNALPDIFTEARRIFREQFDLVARARGKPIAALIDADRIAGLRRRVPDPAASLFTFLPVFVLDGIAQARVRDLLVASLNSSRSSVAPAGLEKPKPPIAEKTVGPMLVGLGALVLVLIAVLAVLAFNGTQQTTVPDTNPPMIKQVNPPHGAILPSGKAVVIQANFNDDRGVDLNSVRLIIDSRDVTLNTTVSGTSISYATDLDPGQQIAVVELSDTAGNKSSQTWNFSVLEPTPTVTQTPIPTITPFPVATNPPIPTPPIPTPPPSPTRAPTMTPPPTFTRTPLPALPDLTVTEISLSPNDEIIYMIRNIGEGDAAEPFLIQVTVDGVMLDSNRRVNSLGADQLVSLFVPNYRLSGTRTVAVSVNSDKSIQESNYANDVLIRTLAGPLPSPTPTLIPSATPTFTPTLTPTPTQTPTEIR